jgi:hypothetical protein
MRKARKNYTPAEKVAILKRHLLEKEPVSDTDRMVIGIEKGLIRTFGGRFV